jgi:hypothetical protein
VLGRHAQPRFELLVSGKLLGERCHFDGLRPSAENSQELETHQ